MRERVTCQRCEWFEEVPEDSLEYNGRGLSDMGDGWCHAQPRFGSSARLTSVYEGVGIAIEPLPWAPVHRTDWCGQFSRRGLTEGDDGH